MPESIVPQYQPADVTAQAPRQEVSPFLAARSGQEVGEALQGLGRSVGELAVPFAKEQGAADAQTAVTRAPDGTPQVATPQTSFIFGQAGDAYGAAVQAGETAKLHTMMQSDMADMATKYQGDPQGFKQNAAAYVQDLAGAQSSPVMQSAISNLGNELGTQHYQGLVDQKARLDVNNSFQSLQTQIGDSKNELFALARQPGGTSTPEYADASKRLNASYDTIKANPLFGIPADKIESERSNAFSMVQSQTTVAAVDRIVQKQGPAAAQKQLEDGILNNPSLNLSDAERETAYRTGLARISYLQGQNKAQIDANRQSVMLALKAYAGGHAPPDTLTDSIENHAQQLGDTESVQQIEAARAVYDRVTAPMINLAPDQRAASIMGGSDYLTALHATENPSGNPYASPGTSSALGPNQFTAGTWAQVASEHPELGLTPDGRTDAAQNAKAIAAFTADNRAFLQSKGIDPNDKNTYMAHFLGAGGGAQFIEAMQRDPAQTAASLFPQQAAANHAVFYNPDGSARTLSDTYNFATRKFGSGTTPLGPPSANGVPFTAQELNQNPYLASEYLRTLASDAKIQTQMGKSLGTGIEQGLKNNYMPSPDTLGNFFQIAAQNPEQFGPQAARIRTTIAGTAYGEAAVGQGSSGASLIQAADARAQGGSILQQKFAEAASASFQRASEQLKQDPYGEAASLGWISKPPDPLNFQDPNALAAGIHQRGIAAALIASHTGAPAISAFDRKDEPQVKAILASGSLDQRVSLLSTMNANLRAPIYQATIARLAGSRDTAAFAMAGAISRDNPDAARGILTGQALAQAEPGLVPKEPGPAFMSAFPMRDFPRQQVRGAVFEAAKAYYAKLSADANDASGKLNSDRMRQAVDAVTGGVLSFNGSNVIAPWYGASQGQLSAAINSLTDADFAGARTADGSQFPAAALQRRNIGSSGNWRLQSIGQGKYLVFSGDDQNRRYLGRDILDARDQGPNEPPGSMPGGPFVLDLSRFKGIPESTMPITLSPPRMAPLPPGLTLPSRVQNGGFMGNPVQPLPVSSEIGQ